MRIAFGLAIAMLFVMAPVSCSKQTRKFPEETPDKVVTRFYELIADGGKIANREAFGMVSTKYRELAPSDFRKWTETYNAGSKVKVLETIMPDKPTADGAWIAHVSLEVQTPSSFGDTFSTHASVNCILDEDKNEWKVDFMADSIEEEDFMKYPAEAVAPEDKDI